MTKRQSIEGWGERLMQITPATHENFRPIPETDGRYLIDRAGNAVSTAHHQCPDGYAWKLHKHKSRIAYAINRLAIFYSDGVKRLVSVGRLVLMAWVSPPPSEYHLACHLNGDGTDDRLENLEWRMPVGVKKRSIERGTWIHGERCHRSRRTQEQANAVCRIIREFHVPKTLLATAMGELKIRVDEILRDSWQGKEHAIANSGRYSALPSE